MSPHGGHTQRNANWPSSILLLRFFFFFILSTTSALALAAATAQYKITLINLV
jgi:hypothetical protein